MKSFKKSFSLNAPLIVMVPTKCPFGLPVQETKMTLHGLQKLNAQLPIVL